MAAVTASPRIAAAAKIETSLERLRPAWTGGAAVFGVAKSRPQLPRVLWSAVTSWASVMVPVTLVTTCPLASKTTVVGIPCT